MSEEKAHSVVLAGESGVGKTYIYSQFFNYKFDETAKTITSNFSTKTLDFPDGKSIAFDIWDTPGPAKYRLLVNINLHKADAVILVYDVTSQKSFDELKNNWYGEIQKIENKNVVIAVAANKSDLYEKKEVSNEEGEKFAYEIGAIFGITSAKTNTGIQALFDNIGRKILDPKFDYAANEKKMNDNSENKMKIEEKKEKTEETKKTEKKPTLTSPIKRCCGLENCNMF